MEMNSQVLPKNYNILKSTIQMTISVLCNFDFPRAKTLMYRDLPDSFNKSHSQLSLISKQNLNLLKLMVEGPAQWPSG